MTSSAQVTMGQVLSHRAPNRLTLWEEGQRLPARRMDPIVENVFLLDFADVLQFQAYALPRQQVYFVLTEVMEFG